MSSNVLEQSKNNLDRCIASVNDKQADVLSDWLDTFESIADSDILLVKFDMIFSNAGKDDSEWLT